MYSFVDAFRDRKTAEQVIKFIKQEAGNRRFRIVHVCRTQEYAIMKNNISFMDIVELKSRVHHKEYWDTWSAMDCPVDPPGLGSANLVLLDYKHLAWDLYPIGDKYRK